MLKFLSLAMLFLISCAASFAQEPQKPVAQGAQVNPCESATTQADLNKCSGEEFLKADEHLNAVYQNLSRTLQQAVHDAKKLKDENLTNKRQRRYRNCTSRKSLGVNIRRCFATR
jgi:uncharacterized protein YecT (DUF1311 family)